MIYYCFFAGKMKNEVVLSYGDIKEKSMKTVVTSRGCLGSNFFKVFEKGPIIYIYDYRNQNRQTRSDKGYSLRAAEDIPPNTIIAHFEGNITKTNNITDKMQSILLCNNESMLRPCDDELRGEHVAWCANDARFEKRENGLTNNAKISGYGQIRKGKRTSVSLVSTKKIRANSEIFCNYGKTYNVVKKANDLRKNPINKAIYSLRVHDKREKAKEMRSLKGLVPLKRGRPKKWCKNTKIVDN